MIRTPSLQLLQMIAKLIDGMFQLSTGDDNFCSWKEKARTWQNYTRHKKASHQSLPAQHFTVTATIHTTQHFTATATIYITQTLYCNSYHTHNTNTLL